MSGRFANQARGVICTLAGVTFFIYCFYAYAAAPLGEVGRSLNIDKTQISVSGISSGGFMAHQFHVAHSSNVMGAGIVAGGPYYCAEGSIVDATTKCSKFMALECNTPMTGLAASFTNFCNNPYSGPRTDEQSIGVAQQSFATAATWSNQGRINPTSGLSHARVYLFTGLNDEIVPFDVMNAVYHFYSDTDKANLSPDNITLNRQFPAHHTMVRTTTTRPRRTMSACAISSGRSSTIRTSATARDKHWLLNRQAAAIARKLPVNRAP